MQALLDFVHSWTGSLAHALSEHPLALAALSIVAAGSFMMLQKDLRPYNLVTNLALVVLGWLAAISLIAPTVAALRDGWHAVRESAPFAAKLAGHLYAIGERHPLVVLAAVAVGTSAYFVRALWPRAIAWAPVRAVCAAFGIALAIHIAGPIADLAAGEPAPRLAAPPAPTLPQLPAREAVARAIAAGDMRYVSVARCIDEVAGYPAAGVGEPLASPWATGVKSMGSTCAESFGRHDDERTRKLGAYAAEYNRLMYEHNAGVRQGRPGG